MNAKTHTETTRVLTDAVNVLVLTYHFEIPTTAETGESVDTLLDFFRKNPAWPLAYLRKVRGEVVPPGARIETITRRVTESRTTKEIK